MICLAKPIECEQLQQSFALYAKELVQLQSMLQISANFEGTYPDLIHFINLLDKSDRLLIIESLNATPQQSGGRLNVMLKLDTFVQEDGSAQ